MISQAISVASTNQTNVSSERRGKDAKPIEIPLSALEFQHHLQTRQPVDELIVDPTTQVQISGLANSESDLSRRTSTQVQAETAAAIDGVVGSSTPEPSVPRYSRPASSPPRSEAVAPFPKRSAELDLSSEPNVSNAASEPKGGVVRDRGPDDLKLTDQARRQEQESQRSESLAESAKQIQYRDADKTAAKRDVAKPPVAVEKSSQPLNELA